MHYTVSEELCVLKTRNKAKHPSLLTECQMSLETNDIIHRAFLVLTTELNCCKGILARSGIRKSNRLHRTKAKCVISTGSHNLNRHTSLEYSEILLKLLVKGLERRRLSINKLVIEDVILLLCHRTVKIILGIPLAPPGGKERNVCIYRRKIHDGSSGIKEMKLAAACKLGNIICQCLGCKRSAGNYTDSVIGNLCNLTRDYGDIGVISYFLGYIFAEKLTVYRKSRSGRNLGGVSCFHYQ